MSCKYAYVDREEFKKDPYILIKCKHPTIIEIFGGICKSQRACKHKGRCIVSEKAMSYCKYFKH